MNEYGFNPLFLSSINCDFPLGNTVLNWKTPTPTGLFRFTGKPISLDGMNSMELSKGHGAYCATEILPVLMEMKNESLKNISFDLFRKNLIEQLNISI